MRGELIHNIVSVLFAWKYRYEYKEMDTGRRKIRSRTWTTTTRTSFGECRPYVYIVTNEYFLPSGIQTTHWLSPSPAPLHRVAHSPSRTCRHICGGSFGFVPEMRVCFSVANVSVGTRRLHLLRRFLSWFLFILFSPSLRSAIVPSWHPTRTRSCYVFLSLSRVSARHVLSECTETRCRLSSRLRLLPGGNAT